MNSPHDSNDVPTMRQHVFVTGAASRAQLIAQVAELRGSINDSTRLDVLAATLASQNQPGRYRLAVIAATQAELLERLERALERLKDVSCVKIRDNAGVYFVDQPLYAPGRVAFLFPGEGAQYLGMLAGLRERFPQIESVLDESRQIEPRLGIPDGMIERVLCSMEVEVPQIAALLQDFGFSIFAVMACSWCLGEVLGSLGIEPDVIAGHSAGESTALFVSGAIRDGTPYSVLETIADIGKYDGAGSAMLAVGAGKSRVEELLAAEDLLGEAAQLFVAMDNCPHQVIVVGEVTAIERAQVVLKKANLVLQKLSIPRPYHTPLFRPYMPALRELSSQVEMQKPHTTLYSCTTAQPFSDDPEQIRQLAIDHWEQPVEFTRLIEQMHDDGARIFVEVGPRGNLTSFTEDILRGRSAVTIAANRMGRSATLQVLHLVSELWVHGLPLKLDTLENTANALSPPSRDVAVPTAATRFQLPATAHSSLAGRPRVLSRNQSGLTKRPRKQRIWDAIRRTSAASTDDQRQQALVAHQRVMQEFLQTQRSVINGYLQTRGEPPATGGGGSLPPILDQPSIARPPLPPPQGMPLAGEVIEHVPGERLTIRRPLDLAEDLYADHHTVGGQSISGVNPQQHGLPVMPMTFFLELIAEAAKQLFPELQVTALRRLRLRKWLPFYAEDPGSVEVTVQKHLKQVPGSLTLTAEVTDLGSSQTAQRLGEQGQAAACHVEMRTDYLEPSIERFVLKDAWPCPVTNEQLYMNLFHGPLLQGVTTIDLMDEQFIESSTTVQPREGLFASSSQPNFVLDPATLDIVMHPMAAWHLAHPDQTGRIMLPFEQEEIEFFGAAPEVGEKLYVQGQLEKMTTRQCIHRLVVRRADGRPWCHMRRAKFWRFYLPFHNVNFHGPKDIYYLSEDWTGVLPSSAAADDQRAEGFLPEQMSCIRFEPPQDLINPAIQTAASYVVLSPREKAAFEKLDGSLEEKGMWMFQRFAAKDAVRRFRELNLNVRTFAADVEVQAMFENGPAMSKFSTAARDGFDQRPFPPVAVVGREGFYYAVASFNQRLGIEVGPDSAAEVPSHLQPLVDQLTTAIDEPVPAIQRVMLAVAAINAALDEPLAVAAIRHTAWHPVGDGGGFLEVKTTDGNWVVWSARRDKVIVSIAIDESIPINQGRLA